MWIKNGTVIAMNTERVGLQQNTIERIKTKRQANTFSMFSKRYSFHTKGFLTGSGSWTERGSWTDRDSSTESIM
jgi:hypothetical protein